MTTCFECGKAYKKEVIERTLGKVAWTDEFCSVSCYRKVLNAGKTMGEVTVDKFEEAVKAYVIADTPKTWARYKEMRELVLKIVRR